MKAIRMTEFGPAEVLKLVDGLTVPTPGMREVLIRVAFSGINRPDVLQRKGLYPAPPGVPSDIPGLEVSGEIVECGAGVERWVPGDQVCALIAGGGYAEYVVADAGSCLPVPNLKKDEFPSNLCLEQAAAWPETLFTVWHNVFQRGGLKRGERFLVHGGSGGIGTTAIQLAALWKAEVYTTARDKVRCARCVELGANEALPYTEVDFAEFWSGQCMDLILDSIGGDYFVKNLSILKDEGRLIYINSTAGRRVELDLLTLMRKRIHLSGSTLRNRSSEFKRALRDEIENQVWPYVVKGRIRAQVDRIFPVSEVVEAHKYLESGAVFGKIVLSWK